jgi:hypothetical protein
MKAAHTEYKGIMKDWKFIRKYVNPGVPDKITTALNQEKPFGGQVAQKVLKRAFEGTPEGKNVLNRMQKYYNYNKLRNVLQSDQPLTSKIFKMTGVGKEPNLLFKNSPEEIKLAKKQATGDVEQ